MDGASPESYPVELDNLYECYGTLAEAEAAAVVRLFQGWSLIWALSDHSGLCVNYRHGHRRSGRRG